MLKIIKFGYNFLIMKKLQLLAFFILFIGSYDAVAQYGYGQPYSPGGVDRSIDNQRNAPKTKNKKAKEKKDPVDIVVGQLAKELKLDDFQQAAMKNIYNEHLPALTAVTEEDTPLEVKIEKSSQISKKIDKQILAILSKDQAAIYNKMIEEREANILKH